MEYLVILIPITALCIPIVAIVGTYRYKLAVIKLKMQGQADERLVSEMQDLKRQISELRDTSTRYDMSFDAALQRIESRVGHVEGRVRAIESAESVQTFGPSR